MYRVWREVLAGPEAWCPSGLQLPRVLELDLHPDACSRHWLALKHLNESLPGATAWRIHSFKPPHCSQRTWDVMGQDSGHPDTDPGC